MTLCSEKLIFPYAAVSKETRKAPEHVAIIMDGNRRWANLRKVPIVTGYRRGAENLITILRAAKKLGIQTLTTYAFSTENWLRPRNEVKLLMYLMESYLLEFKEELKENGVCLKTIGDLSRLSPSLQRVFEEVKEETSQGKEITFVLAINYGGRDEILRSVRKILEDHDKQLLDKENFTEEIFVKYLDTYQIKDPDLLIRTSGERRISNFLLWQISYSEIHITDTLWPDFSVEDLCLAIGEYQNRHRRGGK